MFKLFVLAAVALAVTADTAYPTEAESRAQLQAAGMSAQCIDGLAALTNKFTAGYPTVASNQAAADKFITDYRAEVQAFVNAMSPSDRSIYDEYLKKYGLSVN